MKPHPFIGLLILEVKNRFMFGQEHRIYFFSFLNTLFTCKYTYTLLQTYKRTPYIFTLVLKVKIDDANCLILYINHGFSGTVQVILFQNDPYVLHRRSPSKGTIISKMHTGLQYKTFHRNVIRLQILLTAGIQDE